MALKLKPSPPPLSPFSFNVPSPDALPDTPRPSSPPTSWLSGRDMKVFGARPLTSTSDIGVVKCKECGKPVLRSFMAEHADTCAAIRSGVKKGKGGKVEIDDGKKGGKKRKASPSPEAPSSKKAKPATKVTKGRMKGPVDYDKQCGVINDKGLPCSRSLTCKSHSMGSKRSVQGRSRDYDLLLLDWQRANNPNFVEKEKRETKAEKKEKKEREKMEKKRLAVEAAAAAGEQAAAAGGAKKAAGAGASSKKGGKKAAAAAAAQQRLADEMRDDVSEDLDDLDSDVEVEEMIRSVRAAKERGVIGVPLAVPCDASSWFVQRRERARCCRDLLMNALGSGGGTGGIASSLINRSTSMSSTVGTSTRLPG